MINEAMHVACCTLVIQGVINTVELADSLEIKTPLKYEHVLYCVPIVAILYKITPIKK